MKPTAPRLGNVVTQQSPALGRGCVFTQDWGFRALKECGRIAAKSPRRWEGGQLHLKVTSICGPCFSCYSGEWSAILTANFTGCEADAIVESAWKSPFIARNCCFQRYYIFHASWEVVSEGLPEMRDRFPGNLNPDSVHKFSMKKLTSKGRSISSCWRGRS